MYFSTDKLYKLSKEALRGKKQEIVYEKLINWTKEEFDIKVIYIDLEIKTKDNQPRLHLILEAQKDYQKILTESGYNPKIQSKIAKKFNELLNIEYQKIGNKSRKSFVDKLLLKIGLKGNIKQNFENIWVCYSVFLTVYSTEISKEFTKKKN